MHKPADSSARRSAVFRVAIFLIAVVAPSGPTIGRKPEQNKNRMEWNLHVCVMLVVLFGDVLAAGDVIQEANPNKLSPDRRVAMEERCQRIRRDCIATGDIFRRSVVCAGGGKRFINECALQLRSCDLLLDTGEEIVQERCFWVVKEDEPEERPVTKAPPTVDHYTSTPGLETTTSRIIVDYFFTSPESTRVTTGNPSTEVLSTTGNPSTEVLATTSNKQTTIASSTPWRSIDDDSYFDFLEFTTKDSGGFKPPDEARVRNCCRGDTPCDSCLPQNKAKGEKVCGSDGKTYETECALDTEACDTGKEDLVVESVGICNLRGDLGKRQI